MQILPGGSSPPPTNVPTTEQLPRVAAPQPLPGELPGRQPSPEQLISQRLLAQVVAQRSDGLAQLRVASNNTLLNLQTNQSVKPGQLVLVETQQVGGQSVLNLQTGLKPMTDQLLRLLLPQNGNLKTLVNQVIQTNTGASAQTSQGGNGLLNLLNPGSAPSKAPTALTTNQPFNTNSQPVLQPQPTSQTNLLQKLTNLVAPRTTAPAQETATPVNTNRTPDILSQLLPTAQLKRPEQVAPLLQPGQTPALLKLVMPLLQTNLARAPVNAEQQQQRDVQTNALTQLAARIILGALRAPNTGNEVEVSRGEWITRFEQSLDSLQVELNVVRDQVREKESSEQNGNQDAGGKIRQWRVRLAFEFEELGLITAFVLLSEQQKMEVQFWTERDSTRIKLEQFRTEFNDKLKGAVQNFGVEQLDVGVYEGIPPPSRQNISSHLIDETA